MSHHPRNACRRYLLFAGLVLGLLFATSGVAQASFGELGRIGEPGLNAKEEGEVGKLTPAVRIGQFGFKFRPFHIIGVDQTTNDVYVLEEYKEGALVGKKEELERFLRLQEFSPTGTLLGHRDLTYTGSDEGVESEQTVEGIAVDPAKSRVYFLVTEVREKRPEKEENVAASLYAFNMTPNGGKELEPATGTTGEGVLAGPEKLLPTSETASVPLLQPQGITVDPATHEVLILAHDCIEETTEEQKKKECSEDELESDEEENEVATDHYVIQRVKENGELGERFVDKSNTVKKQSGAEFLAPASPVVVGSGASERLLANDSVENIEPIHEVAVREDFLDQFPPKASETASRTLVPDVGGSIGPLENIGEPGSDFGGALSVTPDGKTLWGVTRIENEETEGKRETLYGLSERSAETLQSIGWTGGQHAGGADKCVLQPGTKEGEHIQIAAGKEGKVFVLVPEYLTEPPEGDGHFPTKDAIIEFGEGGTGCPQASVAKISALVNGKEVTGSVAVKVPVTLTSFIKQGDALSTKWTIENESTHAKTEETQATYQLQQPTLKHEFTAAGTYKITEELKTDNLNTPTLTVSRTGLVIEEQTEPIKITEQPKSVTVGAGATATFKSAATGKPAPGAPEWLVSHNKGVSFEKDEEDKGALSSELKVIAAPSKTGYEYKAKFTSQSGKEVLESEAATLTVTTEAPEVTTQPASKSVPAGNSVAFTAAAKGSPTPTVRWEVSRNAGATFETDETDEGATTDTLTIPVTTSSDNGNEYRAVFSNGIGSPVDSKAATLTVTAAGGGGGGGGGTGGGTGGNGGGTVNPPPTGESEVKGETRTAPHATIASASSVTVSSSGVLSIKVSCPTGATGCAGTVTLKTASAVAARASAAKAKKAILTLATGAFSVGGGQTKTITLHLSSAGRKLLAHSHVLAAKATVLAHDAANETSTSLKTLTLRLAKGKH